MKNWALALLLFAFLGNISQAQSKYEELELTGPIKTITITNISDNKLFEPVKLYNFSADKKLQIVVTYYKEKKVAMVYDLKERPEITVINSPENIETVFTYDESKQIFEAHTKEGLKMAGELDIQGRIIKTYTATDGEPLYLSNPKQPKELKLLTYDPKGNQICEEMFLDVESTQKSLVKINYQYNDKNQTIFERWERVDREGEITEKTLSYDDRGFLVEIKGIEINTKKDLGSFTFIYDKVDSQGNWLERKRLLQGREVMTESRVIEYY